MIRLLRLLKGYILFEASGGFPERFLNLCKIRGINLRSMELTGDTIRAYTDMGGFRRINEAAERSGMEVRVIKESGLPFFLRRHKWRCGVAVGIVMVAVFIWIMSGFVWQVEVVGENTQLNIAIEQDLKMLGVHSGARKSKINIQDVQEEMLILHEDINWISLNIFGGKAQVEYTPAKEKLPMTDTESPVNIVATKKGQITLVECYNGMREVKEGAYVSRGELLISGVNVNADGTERITHASGKVFAYTENESDFICRLKGTMYITQGEDPSYGINLFGLVIPFGKRNNSEESSMVYINARGNDTELPVGTVRYDGFSCYETDVTLTEHQAMLLNLCQAVDEKREGYGEADMKNVSYSTEITDETFILKQKICCVENIAMEQSFYVEKN